MWTAAVKKRRAERVAKQLELAKEAKQKADDLRAAEQKKESISGMWYVSLPPSSNYEISLSLYDVAYFL